MDWIIKGGPVMAALIPCSIIALAVFIERMIFLHHISKKSAVIVSRIQSGDGHTDKEGLLALCESGGTPIGRVLAVLLRHPSRPRAEMERVLEDTAKLEVPKLEKYLSVLATIAGIAPMLGFLGTVTGMIRSFNVMSIQGTGNPAALAGGISEALITTAVGLIIAIPALIAYNYLVGRVNTLVMEMEVSAGRLMEGPLPGPASSGRSWSRL
jgi:biopolymer transport protein ExbB